MNKYTKEQEDFIKDNANSVSVKELVLLFNNRFGTEHSYSAISQKCNQLGCKKLNRATEEQVKFLIDRYETMDWQELTKVFNEYFGTNFSRKSLNRLLYERGYRKYRRHHYSETERDFLKENLEKYSYPKLTEVFNSKFNTACTVSSITQQCMLFLGIKKGSSYIPHNVKELGEEVTKRKVQGYETVYVKVAEGLKDKKSEMWKPKHQVIWEQHNRPITDDEVVIFLDKDRNNFDINNLYCIPKKIMSVMNLNKWFTESREHTLTAIKWCELHYAKKEIAN